MKLLNCVGCTLLTDSGYLNDKILYGALDKEDSAYGMEVGSLEEVMMLLSNYMVQRK